MEEYVLTPSSMWGAVYKARGSGVIRAMQKAQLAQEFAYPILDHSKDGRKLKEAGIVLVQA